MASLIFGANGQDGYYLNKFLNEKGIETIGISRSGNWLFGDVSDFRQVEHLIKEYQPKYVFHFAANSTTRHNAVFDNHQAIADGTLNILEAVYRHCLDSKVFITGSGLQFENTGWPISENDNFKPNNLYAMARIYSVYLARYYRTMGVRTYVGYLFHHESPYRTASHISMKIINSVKAIISGKKEILHLGNIEVEKEWTFAGDIVHGIVTLIGQDKIYEAVIGSGIAYSIRDWLEICFGMKGLDWKEFVTVEESFIPEYKRLVSDPATIFSLGWRPTINIKGLAEMMLCS